MTTGTNGIPQLAVPTAEGVKDALEAIQAACKARKWTLIAPDGRVWQNENPMLISAALLAELGGYMQPLGGDFARILDENRRVLYGDTEATTNMQGQGDGQASPAPTGCSSTAKESKDMSKEKAEYHPEWEPDCQGKWDYDCDLVSLSCRYWPRGGGFHTLDTNTGAWEGNEARPEIRPSAMASICIGDLAIGPYETLAKAEFDGDTESEVKAKVEVWAKEMIARVDAAIRREFQTPSTESETSTVVLERGGRSGEGA